MFLKQGVESMNRKLIQLCASVGLVAVGALVARSAYATCTCTGGNTLSSASNLAAWGTTLKEANFGAETYGGGSGGSYSLIVSEYQTANGYILNSQCADGYALNSNLGIIAQVEVSGEGNSNYTTFTTAPAGIAIVATQCTHPPQ
jgi:hypothetical protein